MLKTINLAAKLFPFIDISVFFCLTKKNNGRESGKELQKLPRKVCVKLVLPLFASLIGAHVSEVRNVETT